MRDRGQRVCLRGSSSSWCRVCSGVRQGSVLGPVLFLIFINDLDSGVSNEVLEFADDTKLFREVASRQDSICIQEDLNRLVEWAGIWQMQFSEGKCKVMHLGSRNEKFSYTMNNHVLEETNLEKDLGIQVSYDLKVSIHCQHSYNRANRMLGLNICLSRPENDDQSLQDHGSPSSGILCLGMESSLQKGQDPSGENPT